jgi:hypothetical protein
MALAEQVERFGRLFRQTDDALRVIGHLVIWLIGQWDWSMGLVNGIGQWDWSMGIGHWQVWGNLFGDGTIPEREMT